MNRITVYGRVSSDIQSREVGGRKVASFGVAGQTRRKAADGSYLTNFYRASVWGANSDTAARYLHKGNRVVVTGDLVLRKYTGNDGVEHYSPEIDNADFSLVETRAESASGAPAQAAAAPASPASFTRVEPDDGELPF